MKKFLLTGIPRSGTTLSCKILNALENTIALHEPLNPGSFKSETSSNAILEVIKCIDAIEDKLINGEAFEHGNAQSLVLDNPIEVNRSGNLRRLKAKRGLLTLPPQPATLNLVIKQNALFASLIHEAVNYFHVVSVVRNPVDVLLSWMNVDLPINKGRIPGGEKFCNKLKVALDSEPDVLKRQIYIYGWFINRFTNYANSLIKYEDIVESNGNALINAFGFDGQSTMSIEKVARVYNQQTLDNLRTSVISHIQILSNQYYDEASIKQRLQEVCEA